MFTHEVVIVAATCVLSSRQRFNLTTSVRLADAAPCGVSASSLRSEVLEEADWQVTAAVLDIIDCYCPRSGTSLGAELTFNTLRRAERNVAAPSQVADAQIQASAILACKNMMALGASDSFTVGALARQRCDDYEVTHRHECAPCTLEGPETTWSHL